MCNKQELGVSLQIIYILTNFHLHKLQSHMYPVEYHFSSIMYYNTYLTHNILLYTQRKYNRSLQNLVTISTDQC